MRHGPTTACGFCGADEAAGVAGTAGFEQTSTQESIYLVPRKPLEICAISALVVPSMPRGRSWGAANSSAKKTIASTEPATVSLMASAPAVAPISLPAAPVQWPGRLSHFVDDRERLLRKLARRLKLRAACLSTRRVLCREAKWDWHAKLKGGPNRPHVRSFPASPGQFGVCVCAARDSFASAARANSASALLPATEAAGRDDPRFLVAARSGAASRLRRGRPGGACGTSGRATRLAA